MEAREGERAGFGRRHARWARFAARSVHAGCIRVAYARAMPLGMRGGETVEAPEQHKTGMEREPLKESPAQEAHARCRRPLALSVPRRRPGSTALSSWMDVFTRVVSGEGAGLVMQPCNRSVGGRSDAQVMRRWTKSIPPTHPFSGGVGESFGQGIADKNGGGGREAAQAQMGAERECKMWAWGSEAVTVGGSVVGSGT